MSFCKLCKSGEVELLLDLAAQPITSRFLSQANAPELLYHLSLGQCQSCALVQLIDHPPAADLKPVYDWITYREEEDHLDQVAEEIVNLPGITNASKIMGVSYKDDTLLERLRKKRFSKVTRLDPDSDLGLKDKQSGVEVIQRKMTREAASQIVNRQGKSDVVIARHILEHCHNINEFIASLYQLVNLNGYVIIEVPSCDKAFDLLDYSIIWEEHLFYFTPETIRNSLSYKEFSLFNFKSYSFPFEDCLVSIWQPSQNPSPQSTNLSLEWFRARNFSRQFANHSEKIRQYLSNFKRNQGKIALLGAGHLAGGFINFLNLKEYLEFVVDDNKVKQNLFMAGSRLPIYSSQALLDHNIKLCLLSLNPRKEEIVIGKNSLFTANGGKFLSSFSESKYSLLRTQLLEEVGLTETEEKNYLANGLRRVSEGVFYKTGEIVQISSADLRFVKSQAKSNPRGIARICAHQDPQNGLHEMIIAAQNKTYIRPHKHHNKTESFHVIEGSLQVIIFSNDGEVIETIQLGDPPSGRNFFYRLSKSYFHTINVISEMAVFHEVTTGPFIKEETVYPLWAPTEGEIEAVELFKNKMENLTRIKLTTEPITESLAAKGIRFIIVGASGFVGRYLFDYLKSQGYEVIGTQISSQFRDLIHFDLSKDRITDKINLSGFSDIQTVAIIPAFISQIDRCFREKETSYKVNVEGMINLLNELVTWKVKPVFISTGSVFSGEVGYYNEDSRRDPICEYGRHKAAVEEFIENNLPQALVLRLDKVVGDDLTQQHLFSEWYNLILENKPLICIKDQIFSPTFVGDVAKGILLSCLKNLSGIYHLANGEFFSREELAKQFISHLNREIKHLNYQQAVISKPHHLFPFADYRPLKSYLNSRKLVAATAMRFTTMNGVFESFISKLRQN